MQQDSQCPACWSDQTKITVSDYKGFVIKQCDHCGCEYCLPFEAPRFEFYAEASDSESIRRHTVLSKWHKSHPTHFSANLTSGAGKTLLDIGCGNGDFAEFAAGRGFSVTGIDIDQSSLKIARSRNLPNTNFLHSNLSDFIAKGQAQFDIVSMFEVFEHLDNPYETIQMIQKVLKPGGLFIGTLPNEHRYFAKKINLEFALPPYHLTYWTGETWTRYLELIHHFRKETCSDNVYYGYLSNILMEQSLQHFNLKEKKNVLRLMIASIFQALKKIETIIEKTTGRSSSFYFEFRTIWE